MPSLSAQRKNGKRLKKKIHFTWGGSGNKGEVEGDRKRGVRSNGADHREQDEREEKPWVVGGGGKALRRNLKGKEEDFHNCPFKRLDCKGAVSYCLQRGISPAQAGDISEMEKPPTEVGFGSQIPLMPVWRSFPRHVWGNIP